MAWNLRRWRSLLLALSEHFLAGYVTVGRFFDRWCSWLVCEGDFVMNGARVAALNEQIYQLQRQTVEGLINERLLTQEATRRGISAAELLEADRSFCQVDRGRVRAAALTIC